MSKYQRNRLPVLLTILAIIFPNIGGLIGALISKENIANWYPTLEKPTWTPPKWLFAPMWVVLYLLLGIGSVLVYRTGNGLKGPAKWCLLIYLLNIALNWSWSPVFFGNQDILGGFVLIIFISITAVIMGVAFGSINWISGLLIVPYCIWLSLATALNGWIYYNN